MRTLAIATDCNKDIQDDIYVDGDCFGVDAEHTSRSLVDQQSSDSSSESMFYVGPPSSSNINSRYQGVGATSQGGAAAGQRPSQPPHANLPTACMTAAATVGHEDTASYQGRGTGTGLSWRMITEASMCTLAGSNEDYVDISHQDGAVEEATTHGQSSAAPTFAHTSVADAYKDEQYCMSHNSRIAEPNTGETQFVGHYTFIPLHHHP